MNATNADEQRSTDLPLGLIGTDAEGATHEIDPADRTVYVHRDGDVEHTEALDDQPVMDWVAYVESERGWDDLRYVDDPLGGIPSAVKEARA